MTHAATPQHLTPHEVARRWQVSVRTVQRMIRSGELVALHLGPKLIRIRHDDMIAFENSRPS